MDRIIFDPANEQKFIQELKSLPDGDYAVRVNSKSDDGYYRFVCGFDVVTFPLTNGYNKRLYWIGGPEITPNPQGIALPRCYVDNEETVIRIFDRMSHETSRKQWRIVPDPRIEFPDNDDEM